MASSDLKPVYLLTGTDQPKVDLALKRLRARFEPGSVDVYAAESCSGEEAVAATNALGLFGGGERLVIVEGVERWRKADAEAIARYGSEPAPGSVLALRCDPERVPAGLEETVARAGEVLRYGVLDRNGKQEGRADYAKWVQGQFAQVGVQVDHAAAQRLVELVGEHTHALRSEIDKLAVWAGGDPIGTREIEELVMPEVETKAFALVDAWGRRDVAGALRACETMLMPGEKDNEPFIVAARLGTYVSSVRAVQALLERDMSVREIAQRLGLKDFPARKQAGQAENYTLQELGEAVVRAADLDYCVKGGSRVDATLELERAIVDLTVRHERRAD